MHKTWVRITAWAEALWPSLDPGAPQSSWRAGGPLAPSPTAEVHIRDSGLLSLPKPQLRKVLGSEVNRVDIIPPRQRSGEESAKTDAGQTLNMQIFYLKLLDRKALPGGLPVLAHLWDAPSPFSYLLGPRLQRQWPGAGSCMHAEPASLAFLGWCPVGPYP